MIKKLIINADDYGICREVNGAIEDLILAGKLQNVSVLANSWHFEQAAAFLHNRAETSVGAHLNVVEGFALAPAARVKILLDNRGQFLSLPRILTRWLRAPFAVSNAVETEWRAQIELLLDSDLQLAHADSHQHIHAFPPFWKIFVRLCREYKINGARLPRERSRIAARRAAAFALRQSANVAESFSPRENLTCNEHFLGFKRAGFYGEDSMIDDVKNLRAGITEMVVHPSLYDRIPYPKMRGALEYQALQSPKLWRQIEDAKIEIITWTEISKAENSTANQ